jgi:hypothetical protein
MAKKVSKKSKSGNTTVVIVKKNKPKRTDVGRGKPPKEHQFKKGQVANPYGCIGKDPTKHALKNLTNASIKDAIEKTMTCTVKEIEALINDETTTAGHKIILRAVLDATEDGDYSKFDHILERAVGKVANKVDMTSGGLPLGQKLEDKQKVKALLKDIEDEF